VLLLAAPAMRSGDFTVGDLTLFAAYTGQLVWLPYFTGRLLVRRRQTAVSVERMARLLPPGRSADLVAHRPMDLTIAPDAPPAPLARPAGVASGVASPAPGPLLAARGLVATHTGGRRGLLGVDLTLHPGTLTVVSGPIGAGKTTLLRALLGLMPAQAGEVSWHGVPVADLAAWMVPPRCAYVAQVPRLFSESLADNLLLGTAPAPGALDGALRLAVLDEDVAAMPEGVATLVGARGVRLSGGQAQRAAVARALVQGPELLVLDDVSSALDTETEARMWARLLAAGTTCLAVSNRAATLARADQVLAMDGGRLVV
jgi:ATP-binding cassette subfamily B protein